jgi:hypothetical protein
MHTCLVFKEQTKVKVLRGKGITTLKDVICFNTKITNKIYIPQSLRKRTKSTPAVPWIFTSSRTELNRKDYQECNHMTWNHKIFNNHCLCSTFQLLQMTKKERKQYALIPLKIAESDPWVMLYMNLVGTLSFTIRTLSKKMEILWIHTSNHR